MQKLKARTQSVRGVGRKKLNVTIVLILVTMTVTLVILVPRAGLVLIARIHAHIALIVATRFLVIATLVITKNTVVNANIHVATAHKTVTGGAIVILAPRANMATHAKIHVRKTALGHHAIKAAETAQHAKRVFRAGNVISCVIRRV